ncbi:Maf family protein [Aliidiomarina soli]|uniref:dTTP/UTP pyrophosphatase n=1 Tax=Aliidiomarina soli TaxID=1928574 RepID=A0A432WJR5_9GAMM|nr:Maf family protein [Aliidiomarina soli]RUO34014.1 septum formation inhibitor Maf [Aliidiomarina soli]
MKPLYLASGSPRRYELLQLLQYPFSVIRPHVPEIPQDDEAAHAYVSRLACSKASAGLPLRESTAGIVIGADTIVVVDGDILEKPRDKAHFLQMFSRLSGRAHQVMTAVCVDDGNRQLHDLVTTEIRFRQISSDEAEHYWATGEPTDKAGGYGIQGYAGKFVEFIRGSYFAVVGLPLYETDQLIKRLAEDSR